MRNNTHDTALYSFMVLFISVLFLLAPETVTASVSASLSLCAARVIPAVFPFSVISSLFIATGGVDIIDRLFEGVSFRLFGLRRGASAFLCGLIFGFPLGAMTAAGLKKRGAVSASECERLLCYGCCASPTFPVFAVGKGMFGSLRLGVTIWAVQALSAVLIGAALNMLAKKPASAKKPCSLIKGGGAVPPAAALTSAVTEASRVILNVCGAVTFFSLLGAVAVHFISAVCDRIYIKLLISAFFEFASGCSASASALADGLISRGGAAFFAGFAIGFSGLSVLCQTASLFPDGAVRLLPFIISRLLTGVLTAAASLAAVRFFPESIDVSLFPDAAGTSWNVPFHGAFILAAAVAVIAGEKISTCKRSKKGV